MYLYYLACLDDGRRKEGKKLENGNCLFVPSVWYTYVTWPLRSQSPPRSPPGLARPELRRRRRTRTGRSWSGRGRGRRSCKPGRRCVLKKAKLKNYLKSCCGQYNQSSSTSSTSSSNNNQSSSTTTTSSSSNNQSSTSSSTCSSNNNQSSNSHSSSSNNIRSAAAAATTTTFTAAVAATTSDLSYKKERIKVSEILVSVRHIFLFHLDAALV